MNGDIYNGKYSVEEIRDILDINARSEAVRKPETAFFKKSAGELGPTWAQKREFVHWLINESNVSPVSKNYLKKFEDTPAKYQLRGFKYGLVGSAFTFFFFPVIKRQTFVRRFGISMIPMIYFMNWGYVWGH